MPRPARARRGASDPTSSPSILQEKRLRIRGAPGADFLHRNVADAFVHDDPRLGKIARETLRTGDRQKRVEAPAHYQSRRSDIANVDGMVRLGCGSTIG